LSNSPISPLNFSDDYFHNRLLVGIPIGVATSNDPEFWLIDEDQWVYVCFE